MAKKWTGKLPDGLSVKWSPANQAWLVMWHETVLRILNTKAEVTDYVRDLWPADPRSNPASTIPPFDAAAAEKRWKKPWAKWTERDFMAESSGEFGKEGFVDIFRQDLEAVIQDMTPGDMYKLVPVVRDAFDSEDQAEAFIEDMERWDDPTLDMHHFPNEDYFAHQVEEQVLNASPAQILAYADAVEWRLQDNPAVKVPGWVTAWLKKNGTGLARKTGALIREPALGCGHWGCVFASKHPEWVVKITLDPAEGPLVQRIMEERAQREGGDGTGPYYVLAGITYYGGLYEGGSVMWRGKKSKVYIIVRERIEPIKWPGFLSNGKDVADGDHRPPLLNWQLDEVRSQLSKTVLAGRGYNMYKKADLKRANKDKYRAALSYMTFAPFLSDTMMEMDYDMGIILSDVHGQNVGLSVVDWHALGHDSVPRGLGQLIIHDVGSSPGIGAMELLHPVPPIFKRLAPRRGRAHR
jgi:hypothetical protein